MKKMNITLIMLAILGTSSAYAAIGAGGCPDPSEVKTVSATDMHYMASGFAGTWTSSDELKLPRQLSDLRDISFVDAYSNGVVAPVWIAYRITCMYTFPGKDAPGTYDRDRTFFLHSPSVSQGYQLDSTNWSKQEQKDTYSDKNGNTITTIRYSYRCDNADVTKCSFIVAP